MSEIQVFLGGEGRNELGSWAGDMAYQNDSEPGVLKALLFRTQLEGWKVIGARSWKSCRKYTDHGPLPADLRRSIRGDHEKRAVLGLVLDAKERGAHAVAFVRDQDDDPTRATTIADAIDQARTLWPTTRVVGETAVPVLEACSESHSKSKAQRLLANRNISTTAQMVSEVLASRPVPEDATSLRSWLVQARESLA
jgi:hypothetical protein